VLPWQQIAASRCGTAIRWHQWRRWLN